MLDCSKPVVIRQVSGDHIRKYDIYQHTRTAFFFCPELSSSVSCHDTLIEWCSLNECRILDKHHIQVNRFTNTNFKGMNKLI